ncbi:hypothetical protein ACU6U9_13110 [Pseudomonas sp. HK3]
MKWMFITFVCVMTHSFMSYSQMKPLDDDDLQQSHGFMGDHISFDSTQSIKRSDVVARELVPRYQAKSPLFDVLTGLSKDDLSLTQGIEIDLDIQASLDMQWLDPDGFSDGADGEGQAGSLTLSGIHLGNHKSPITPSMVNSDQPFLESGAGHD